MIKILFEDKHLVVAVKPAGVVSESTPDRTGFADLLALQTNSAYIGVIHRLDRGVGGVTVYAKSTAAAAALSRALTEGKFKKEYLALVHGAPIPAEGEMRDLLFYDRMQGKSFVVDRPRKGAKEALLAYEVLRVGHLSSGEERSLLRVRLMTGRTHQIRVQLASRRYPLVGDRKYGAPEGGFPALFCRTLAFPHPVTHQEMCFTETPDGVFAEWV